MKKAILFLTYLVLSLSIVYSQPLMSPQQLLGDKASGDFVNGTVVPSVVLFIVIWGIASLMRLPRYTGAILAAAATAGLFFLGIVKILSSVLLAMGGLATTGIYIVLFLVGAMLISKSKPGGARAGAGKTNYYAARSMNRKQIAAEMNNIEKRLIEAQHRLNKFKIQEHNTEIRFANEKTPEVVRELERARKMKNELTDVMDMLLEKREMYKRAYREATS